MSSAPKEHKPSLFYHGLGSQTRLEVTVPADVELRPRSGGDFDLFMEADKVGDSEPLWVAQPLPIVSSILGVQDRPYSYDSVQASDSRLSQKVRDALFAATKLGAEAFKLIHLRTHGKTSLTDKTSVDMVFSCDPESIPHVDSELPDNRTDWEIKLYKSTMGPFKSNRKIESSPNSSNGPQ